MGTVSVVSITGDGDVERPITKLIDEKVVYIVRVCVTKGKAAFWNCVIRMAHFRKRGISGTLNH